MILDESGNLPNPYKHVIVIPIYGDVLESAKIYWSSLRNAGFDLFLVDNNESLDMTIGYLSNYYTLNANQQGIAGAINSAVSILSETCNYDIVTLLDQDSLISIESLRLIGSELIRLGSKNINIIGPIVWDIERMKVHKNILIQGLPSPVYSLILSGLTFRLSQWHHLRYLPPTLEVDFLDLAWCSIMLRKGFLIHTSKSAILYQRFGQIHPNPLCKMIGMQYYSPSRHYYSIKNLKNLWFIQEVSLLIKIDQTLRMLIKPLLWILFEPEKKRNCKSILAALIA